MINYLTCLIRRIINHEFYTDTYVKKIDPNHEQMANYWNGPTTW